MQGGQDVIMRGLLSERRSQESAADQAGLKYLNATKQSGQGMLTTFERFQQQEYVSDQYKDPFVRSHPVATDRLARLRTLVAASPYVKPAGQRRAATAPRPDARQTGWLSRAARRRSSIAIRQPTNPCLPVTPARSAGFSKVATARLKRRSPRWTH